MSIDVRVPTTGNAGEDAVIAEWNVSVGHRVSAGDVLVVLETAKATLDVEAPSAGEVLQILFEEGDEVPEHEILAIIGEPGEISEADGSVAPPRDENDPGGTAPASPTSGLAVHDPAIPALRPGGVTAATGHPGASSDQPRLATRRAVSPRARAVAQQRGIDLADLVGSGPFGRVILRDVPAAAASEPAPAPAPATPAAALPEQTLASPTSAAPRPTPPRASTNPPASDATVVPVRGARKITAQRMHASLQSTAQVTLTRYAEADALLAYAARLKTHAEQTGLPRIGVNDLILFAVSRVLPRHPEANSWFDWDGITQFSSVDLGFAVDTGSALMVPVVRGADRMTLGEIAGAAREAVDKARSGKLASDEMDGGTFTVSNLGSLGVHWFTPVLNPPQSAILGVGATHRASPDAPALLPLSLTFDHRALDGAAAARLLADLATALAGVDVLSAY